MSNTLEKRTALEDSILAQTAQPLPGNSRLGRRSFLKRLGLSGTALVPVAGWVAGGDVARADRQGREDRHGQNLSRQDADILRFLAAAEILETDLWQQYNE